VGRGPARRTAIMVRPWPGQRGGQYACLDASAGARDAATAH
jgi:hypothetical protein